MENEDSIAPAPPPQPRRGFSFRRFLLVVLLLIAAFLAGFIPAELHSRRLADSLERTRLDLRLADLHRRLGVASHEAQRNNFASASDAAREFFDGCSALAQSGALANEPRTQNAITAYSGQRDQIMTMLATADLQVRERLATTYLTMHGVLQRRPA